MFSRVLFLSVLLLASCSAIRPHVKDLSAIKANEGENTNSCDRFDAYKAQTTGASVDLACVNSTINELKRMAQSISDFNLGVSYAAVAAGTYAGYEGTRKRVKTAPLRNTAVGVAGLLGFDQVTNANEHLDSLIAGIHALECVQQSADAVDHLPDPNVAANYQFETNLSSADLQTAYYEAATQAAKMYAYDRVIERDAGKDKKAVAADLLRVTDEQESMLEAIKNSTQSISNVVAAARAQVVEKARQQLTATIKTSQASLPERVRTAVRNIWDTVSLQLLTRQGDASKTFQKQQQSVISIAGDVQKASSTATQVANSTDGTTTPVDLTPAVTAAVKDCTGSL